MKKNDLIIVITFILFLIGPNISYFFLKNKMDLTNYENRNLYNAKKGYFEYCSSSALQ